MEEGFKAEDNDKQSDCTNRSWIYDCCCNRTQFVNSLLGDYRL